MDGLDERFSELFFSIYSFWQQHTLCRIKVVGLYFNCSIFLKYVSATGLYCVPYEEQVIAGFLKICRWSSIHRSIGDLQTSVNISSQNEAASHKSVTERTTVLSASNRGFIF